ncbi:MFS transporter [Streptomyces sp. TS71-3]|uniref:MFS transporter n=1 Tax=Streptomyces sp. TS71-3 TaxID=2733862 RepID=UPI001B099144|nr:MFS transporter [Streptomyces sp. TS71-3]GHJ38470.1 MFS transporter [Streptomyces sp. TS71-3]
MSSLISAGQKQDAAHPAHAWRRRHHSFGFWVAATAFLVNMGFSAVPTPLYVLYQQRDHFSTVMLTVVYAVYAVGVIASLFFGGHLSDWVGRKGVLVPALLINVVSAMIFLFAPGLPGLVAARVVSGISVGLTTATATAYLAELHIGVFGSEHSPRRAQVVATAANLGGIGVGPLVAGLLAQYAPQPLRLPYILFAAVLFVLAVLVVLSPETVGRPEPAPRYRPQRIVVPGHARRKFFVATGAGIASFAVYGVFNSLAPSFLVGTMHQHSHAVAGAVAFAAFAAGAVAQIAMSRAGLPRTLNAGPLILVPGLALLVGGMWLPSLMMFVFGGVLTGAGGGLAFRGALTAAGSTAPAASRAEVLAGFFLGAYIGLSVPVVGLGIATQYVSASTVMLGFVVIAAVAVVGCGRVLAAQHTRSGPGEHTE